MTKPGAEVVGADRLAATMRAAADDLDDMTRPGTATANVIAGRARVEAPRRTGRLAGSLTTQVSGDEAVVTSALPYANRTHWGWAAVGQAAQPFLVRPAYDLVPVWSKFYAAEVDRLVGTVKGA
jgi:phage gpG-like protein